MNHADRHIAGPSRTTADGSGPRRAVLLFARTPAGEARAKPMPGLSFPQRVALFSALTRKAVEQANGSGFDLVIAADGPGTPFTGCGAAAVLVQRGQSFGRRIAGAVSDTFALGYDEIAVIGNDSPELDGDTIRRSLLEREPGELGLVRSVDGGVTLIALDRSVEEVLTRLFDSPRWETEHLFADLCNAARLEGLHVCHLASGSDVDTPADVIRAALAAGSPLVLKELSSALRLSGAVDIDPLPLLPTPRRIFLRTRRQKAPPVPPVRLFT